MHLARKTLVGLALFAGLGVGATRAQSLTTTYATDNGQYGAMFNVAAYTDLTIDCLDVHFADDNNPAPCGATCSVVEVEVYNVTGGGGYKPVADDPFSWTLIGSVQHTVTTSQGTPQPLNLPIGLALSPSGTVKYGMYVTSTGATNSVTGGDNEFQNYTNGANTYNSAELQLVTGYGKAYPFGTTFVPRTWNGTVYYSVPSGTPRCTNPVTSYCTPGTSAAGCQATLSGVGVPSASAVSGFTVIASNVEGQKDGVFFQGTSGQQANPWGNGTSFQCVTPPVNRLGLQVGNGTIGLCDGTKAQDLNDLWHTKPAKNPGSGAVVQVQLWYRDPGNTSNQTTSLSDAISFTVQP